MTRDSSPNAEESERVVLGAMLLHPDTALKMLAQLTPGEFFDPKHGAIFRAVGETHASGDPIEAISVALALDRAGDLQRIGGAAYLHTLVSAVTTADSAAWHARRVADMAVARRTEELGIQIAQAARGGNAEALAAALEALTRQHEERPAEAPRRGTGATSLDAGYGYARRFPIEYLPEQMGEYALDLAQRKQVPVDLTALAMLGILSGVTGPRIVVRRDHDFVEPTNLYTLIGMSSGGAKSPAVTELRNGLWKARQVVADMHAERLREQQEALNAEIEQCLTRANDIATGLEEKAGLKARAKDLQQQATDLAQKPPPAPVLTLDGDTTPEALAAKMAGNGGMGSLVDDEGTLLRNLGGQYSGKTANLAVLLKGYDCHPYFPSRITRETSVMERAALSITISPQPGLVAEMIQNGVMQETGLINRFLLSLPGDLVGKRQGRPSTFIDDAPPRPNHHLRDWWAGLLESLARYDVLTGAWGEEPPRIDLTREAWKLHYDFQEAFEPRMDPSRDGDLCRVRGWASKHVGRVLRIAALLHLAAGFSPDDRLEESTMRDAIAIGDWSIEHLLAAGRVVGLSRNAGRIKEYVDGCEGRQASRTDINKHVFSNNEKAEDIDSWVEELEATGEYVQEKVGLRGRPKLLVRWVGVSS